MDSTFCCLCYRNAISHKLPNTAIVAIACIARKSHNHSIVDASNNIWLLDLTLFVAFAFDEAIIKILSTAIETIGFALMEFKWIHRDYRKDFHSHRMPMPIVYVSQFFCLYAIHPDSDRKDSKTQKQKTEKK